MSTVDVRKQWPEFKEGSYGDGRPGYGSVLDALGEVLSKLELGDYSGDTLAILKRCDKFGYLCFGWGSCSVCDSLAASDTYDELQKLVDDLDNSIVWKDTAAELADYLVTKDWEGQYFYGGEENAKAWALDAASKLRKSA